MNLKEKLKINNRYLLKKYLGAGAFGEVWLASDSLMCEDVALKFFGDMEQTDISDFKAEFLLVRNLSHPNILNVGYLDVWKKQPFLVMEYCSNGASSGLSGRCNEEVIWRFILNVAQGLSYLHSQSEPIIHQDIKPANILIGQNGEFKISDFGVSKRLRSTLQRMSVRAIGVGSIAYMGPERFGEEPLPIKASDIWSLGVSIYEMANGDLPFNGMGGGMQRAGAMTPSLNGKWSSELNAVMQQCLSKEPWNRPTASDLVFIAKKYIQESEYYTKLDESRMVSAVHPRIENNSDVRRQTTKISDPTDDEILNFEFVDLGLSVKWASCFVGAKSEEQLGDEISISDFKMLYHGIDENLIPQKSHFEELFERCSWKPKKIGRVVVGYHVFGPNGNSIYLPFVPVQDKDHKVPKSIWKNLPKEIYVATREEFAGNISCRAMLSSDNIRITTSIIPHNIHYRLIHK